MAATTLEVKAHELLGQLNPGQLAAVVHMLETFLDDDRDTLRPAESQAIAEADQWFQQNDPIPHEEVLQELGLMSADWDKMCTEP